MSHIIAGDPAPTNPSARERLVAKVTFYSDRYEADFLAELDAYRAEVLAEAIEAAQSKRLATALFAGDLGHNNGVADAVAAIGALAKGAAVEAPDPIAYGSRGYRCGCGKDAHSNLVPCAPDQDDVAAQRSVDAQFPIVAAFLADEDGAR
ncbi:hypothetical protein [Streptomyces xanthophaeus]|uniref:hypothetical protein n=1 Tax=Streptomyces xanthophaeus TaxID=67385 RepID=UPI00371E6DA9